MAFFGLTHLGYQNPIGDQMIVNPRGVSPAGDSGIDMEAGILPSPQGQQEPLEDATNGYQESHQRHKEMVKRIQTKSPNQLYKTPLTENQQYGWTSTTDHEPWMQTKRFPRKNSEMTKFFDEISKTKREFCLL